MWEMATYDTRGAKVTYYNSSNGSGYINGLYVLLNDGWEPFGVEGQIVYLKRRKIMFNSHIDISDS